MLEGVGLQFSNLNSTYLDSSDRRVLIPEVHSTDRGVHYPPISDPSASSAGGKIDLVRALSRLCRNSVHLQLGRAQLRHLFSPTSHKAITFLSFSFVSSSLPLHLVSVPFQSIDILHTRFDFRHYNFAPN